LWDWIPIGDIATGTAQLIRVEVGDAPGQEAQERMSQVVAAAELLKARRAAAEEQPTPTYAWIALLGGAAILAWVLVTE